MPGLFGIIGDQNAQNRNREIERMRLHMHDGGLLSSGTYSCDSLRLSVGWTCHRDSYADCMPLMAPDQKTSIIFGGEHYSISRTAEEGHAAGDVRATELLSLYREEGDSFIYRLNGFFHGLLIDQEKGQALLFNDRFGMKRIYYIEDHGIFTFSAEAKALLAIRPQTRAFDADGLAELVSYGAALRNRSLFQGIQVLPGASKISFEPSGKNKKSIYFSPSSWEQLKTLDPERFYHRLKSTFIRRLPLYVPPRGDLGISVTAGLDTRVILAHLKPHDAHMGCYTFCGPYRENLDVTISRKLAALCGYPHHTFSIDQPFFDRFDELAKESVLIAEGNIDLSGAANLYVNKMSRQISPIRLTGNYGSEILRRNIAFGPSNSSCGYFDPDFAKKIRNASAKWKELQNCHWLTFIAFRQLPWYSYNRLQIEQSVLTMRSPFADNELVETMYAAPPEANYDQLFCLQLIADGNPKLARIATDRGVTFPRSALWPLSRAYREFNFKMEYYASHGMPKFAADIDRRLGPFSIEKIFLGRNKYYHFRQWFREELSSYVRDIALDGQTLQSDYWDRKRVEKSVLAHLSGRENHTRLIHMIISLELARRWILKESNYRL